MSHLTNKMFLDGEVEIARYDKLKYPQFDKLTEKQNGFFWRPQEVDLTRDGRDFKLLQPHEQHIFTSNLKRQILLDTYQGRSPSLAFLPIASLPEIEGFIAAWTYFETIHSRSYTHILRNVYPDPSIVFDDMMNIKEIVDCSKDISKYYDELINHEDITSEGLSGYTFRDSEYDHKKKLWMCLNAVNALEGIRFYVSFACSWAFAEVKKMEGNAKIIKFIARDENVHLAFTQQVLKLLPSDDSDFVKIAEDCKQDVIQLIIDVVNQEKQWAKFVFQHGSVIGLNEELVVNYIEWIANKRIVALGYDPIYKTGSNPLPWTQRWIAGADVQVAPQETEITSYIIGGIKDDVSSDSLKKLSL